MKTAYILVAEDDTDDQVIFNAALQESGLPVRAGFFRDGSSLISFLDELISGWPQCLFIDLNMPRMNGLETLEYIKTDPALRHIPAIIMSTSGRHEEIGQCMKSGAADYLVKPDTFELQVLALKKILSPYCHELHENSPAHFPLTPGEFPVWSKNIPG